MDKDNLKKYLKIVENNFNKLEINELANSTMSSMEKKEQEIKLAHELSELHTHIEAAHRLMSQVELYPLKSIIIDRYEEFYREFYKERDALNILSAKLSIISDKLSH